MFLYYCCSVCKIRFHLQTRKQTISGFLDETKMFIINYNFDVNRFLPNVQNGYCFKLTNRPKFITCSFGSELLLLDRLIILIVLLNRWLGMRRFIALTRSFSLLCRRNFSFCRLFGWLDTFSFFLTFFQIFFQFSPFLDIKE